MALRTKPTRLHVPSNGAALSTADSFDKAADQGAFIAGLGQISERSSAEDAVSDSFVKQRRNKHNGSPAPVGHQMSLEIRTAHAGQMNVKNQTCGMTLRL